MKDLAKILLKNGELHLFREKCMELPKQEKEILYKSVKAKVLHGKVNKVIDIYLNHEVYETAKDGNPIKGEMDCYLSEPVYRLPYTEDKELLDKMLNIAKKKIHSYASNQV